MTLPHTVLGLPDLLDASKVLDHDNRPVSAMSDAERRREINRLGRDPFLNPAKRLDRLAELDDLPKLASLKPGSRRGPQGPTKEELKTWPALLAAHPRLPQRQAGNGGRLDPGVMTRVREARKALRALESVAKLEDKAPALVDAVENAEAVFVDAKRPVLAREPERAPEKGREDVDIFAPLVFDEDLFR